MPASATKTKTISVVVIPADPERPLERRDVEGLEGLQAAVGGYIEPIPYHATDEIAVYCNEDGKPLGLAPNPRATRLLGPGLRAGDRVLGDVVACAFDHAAGADRDCPAGFEQTIESATRELPEHDCLNHLAGRTVQYEWDLWTDEEGVRRIAVLSILHYTPTERRSASGEFTATLAEETERSASGGVLRGHRIGGGICLLGESVSRYSAAHRDRFAAAALARLRELYAASEPQVTEHFRVRWGTSLTPASREAEIARKAEIVAGTARRERLARAIAAGVERASAPSEVYDPKTKAMLEGAVAAGRYLCVTAEGGHECNPNYVVVETLEDASRHFDRELNDERMWLPLALIDLEQDSDLSERIALHAEVADAEQQAA